MKVILAEKAGFCYGVKRAVEEALQAKDKYKKTIYTLGQLIHNQDVVDFLKDKGIIPVDIEDLDKLSSSDIIIIRSHGVSLETYKRFKLKGLTIVDATCPYVTNIHNKVKQYYDLGYKIIIVGDKNHPEVQGINGWCSDSAIITKDGSDLDVIFGQVCIVSQTTEKQENWEKVINIVMKKCKEFVVFNTICSATQVRQKVASELSKKVDVMVVIGGKNSSNTTKLYEICRKNCVNTIYVENSGEIPDNIINNNNEIIGVTAGASTPDWIIKEAILKMSEDVNQETNNEQLDFMEKNNTQIVVGKVIKGEIISVSPKQAFVSIGYKVEAVLPKSEVTKDDSINLEDILTVGDIVQAKVISRRNEEGYVVLSKKELEREAAYDELKEAREKNLLLKVVIKEVVNCGLVGNYKGARVFIPASHIELYHVDDLESYLGKEVELNIIEFDDTKRQTRIVGSRREILKAEKSVFEEETWNKLEKDTVVEGEVKRLTVFGAFVGVNGVDGLLHVSEISWGRINKPSDILKVGDKIKVYILDIDKENKKLSLSMKKLIDDPWMDVEVKYPVGNIVLGKVVRFANFGAFIELEPGVDALVHISQISYKKITKPEEVLKTGEMVKAKILDVNKDGKKIGLSIKEVDEI